MERTRTVLVADIREVLQVLIGSVQKSCAAGIVIISCRGRIAYTRGMINTYIILNCKSERKTTGQAYLEGRII